METLLKEQAVSIGKRRMLDRLVRQGFFPIFVKDEEIDSCLLVESAVEAGCTILEYTCRRKDARTIIPWIKREFPHVAILGASLVDAPRASSFLQSARSNFITVDEMVDLGVDGLISFMRFRPETYDRYGGDLVLIPGVHSYNEALDELEKGADFIKLAGNTPWGAGILSSAVEATHGLFPTLVTGGCSLKTIPGFVQAGAVLIATGFDVILQDHINAGNLITREVVVGSTKEILDTFRQARSIHQPDLFNAAETGSENLLASGGWIN